LLIIRFPEFFGIGFELGFGVGVEKSSGFGSLWYRVTRPSKFLIDFWRLKFLYNFKVNALTFDQSGAYLAIGGANVQIFQVKSWNKIYQFDGHTQVVTGINFGENAKFVASSSLDKTVRIFGLSWN